MAHLNDQLEDLIAQLRLRGQRVTFAESCTGGLLASRLTAKPGISDIFQGSFVTYSNQMKRDILGVPSHVLAMVGAVSRPVALHMARGAKALTQADWAVSITGIAGPSGGTDKKPVGTVCFAVVGAGIEQTAQKHFTGERTEIQKASAEFAVQILLETIRTR